MRRWFQSNYASWQRVCRWGLVRARDVVLSHPPVLKLGRVLSQRGPCAVASKGIHCHRRRLLALLALLAASGLAVALAAGSSAARGCVVGLAPASSATPAAATATPTAPASSTPTASRLLSDRRCGLGGLDAAGWIARWHGHGRRMGGRSLAAAWS